MTVGGLLGADPHLPKRVNRLDYPSSTTLLMKKTEFNTKSTKMHHFYVKNSKMGRGHTGTRPCQPPGNNFPPTPLLGLVVLQCTKKRCSQKWFRIFVSLPFFIQMSDYESILTSSHSWHALTKSAEYCTKPQAHKIQEGAPLVFGPAQNSPPEDEESYEEDWVRTFVRGA